VSSLIDNEMNWWKPNILGSLFKELETKLIYAIPISGTNQEDRQV
jgi:hypothetical protein